MASDAHPWSDLIVFNVTEEGVEESFDILDAVGFRFVVFQYIFFGEMTV